ncbi:MAG: RsmE family RNA methyltransferase [bacterium]|jgi:RsmE family RNA methyltransferase|nr:RsmE family RNA methyltransferase [bacterium]
MNLLLYRGSEVEEGRLRLGPGDRRLLHVATVLGLKAGDRLRVGRVEGAMRWARLCADPHPLSPLLLDLEEELLPAPSAREPRTVILALPRPPVLRRLLELAPQLGLGRLVLIRSARVEKSYFQSPLLHRGDWRRHLELGMEQALCTRAPEVYVFDRFRPFVEDELERLLPASSLRLLPHPGPWPSLVELPRPRRGQPWCLAVGPEGGWVESELRALGERGFLPLSLGKRILRVEAAVERLAAQLDLLEELGEKE